jgi:S-DNA-T family DNA segregation ATPase FtsK/SpoIIIE
VAHNETQIDNSFQNPENKSDIAPQTSRQSSTENKKSNPENKQNSISTDVDDLNISQTPKQKEYIFPPLNLLSTPKPKINKGGSPDRDLKETAMKLQSTLDSFGVNVTITNVSVGPAVTRYELQPEQGVKVSKITSLADDIKLNLAASDIRIEAPIPGKAAVGIEVPNKENSMVAFRELIESKDFAGHPSDVAFAVGKDIGGHTDKTTNDIIHRTQCHAFQIYLIFLDGVFIHPGFPFSIEEVK